VYYARNGQSDFAAAQMLHLRPVTATAQRNSGPSTFVCGHGQAQKDPGARLHGAAEASSSETLALAVLLWLI
jgi:hypothetical protein